MPAKKTSKRPGDIWSVLAHRRDGVAVDVRNVGEFDVLCVGDPNWIHLEQMDTRSWYLGVGDHQFSIRIDRKGRPHLLHYKLGDLDELVDLDKQVRKHQGKKG